MCKKIKFFTLFALLLFSSCWGCALPSTSNQDSTSSQSKLEQAEFEKFSDELFASEMSSSDTISIHFSMETPSDYGVDVPETTWGSIESDDYLENKQMLRSLEKKLNSYDYDRLTKEQQLTYDTLDIFLETELKGCKYYEFSDPFSPMRGIQTQIPLVLSEYDFNSKDDIENYLTLLEQSYDYIKSCLDYEKTRSKNGYFMTDYSSEKVREQCMEFLAPPENCLIPVFNDKLSGFEQLSEEEAGDYKARNEAAISTSLIPGYQLIITKLQELEGTRSSDKGLADFKEGKKYYEYLVRSYTGSDKPVKDLIALTEDHIRANLVHMQTLMNDNPELGTMLETYEFSPTEPDAILDHLRDSITEDFPAIPYDAYTLKYVPPSLESLSNPAFYLIPPLDNMEKQVIYINNGVEYESMDLFPVLAHEGFPGHLYASVYFSSLNPHPIRSLLGTTGYHEGWAQYVENYSYQYSGLDSNVAAFLALNSSYSYALYARLDMGVHYQGWDLEDTETYLYEHGADSSFAEEIYYTLVDDPASYLPYYISYLEIMELRDTAKKELGNDFSIKDFHEFFLTTGPTYFDVIAKEMEEWIAEPDKK